MGLSNAERQRLWRERHQMEPAKARAEIEALKARVGELEAQLTARPTATAPERQWPRLRLTHEVYARTYDKYGMVEFDETPIAGQAEITAQEDADNDSLSRFADRLHTLADLAERYGPELADAARREIMYQEEREAKFAESKRILAAERRAERKAERKAERQAAV